VAVDADVAGLIGRAVAAYGRIDVIVNNAGTTHRNRPMLEVSEADFDRVYAVNVKSLFLTARHAVPLMRRQGGGAFITIASTAGVRPRPGLTWYNGSKGAAIVTSRSMAAELAPDRIRVNVINPVAGETGLLAEFMGGDTPELRAKFVATIPLGRLSRPSDVASAAVFLASAEAAFITGACLEVDGVGDGRGPHAAGASADAAGRPGAHPVAGGAARCRWRWPSICIHADGAGALVQH
jgi:3-oxoacyl-[acyl-carrier protein] reductase